MYVDRVKNGEENGKKKPKLKKSRSLPSSAELQPRLSKKTRSNSESGPLEFKRSVKVNLGVNSEDNAIDFFRNIYFKQPIVTNQTHSINNTPNPSENNTPTNRTPSRSPVEDGSPQESNQHIKHSTSAETLPRPNDKKNSPLRMPRSTSGQFSKTIDKIPLQSVVGRSNYPGHLPKPYSARKIEFPVPAKEGTLKPVMLGDGLLTVTGSLSREGASPSPVSNTQYVIRSSLLTAASHLQSRSKSGSPKHQDQSEEDESPNLQVIIDRTASEMPCEESPIKDLISRSVSDMVPSNEPPTPVKSPYLGNKRPLLTRKLDPDAKKVSVGKGTLIMKNKDEDESPSSPSKKQATEQSTSYETRSASSSPSNIQARLLERSLQSSTPQSSPSKISRPILQPRSISLPTTPESKSRKRLSKRSIHRPLSRRSSVVPLGPAIDVITNPQEILESHFIPIKALPHATSAFTLGTMTQWKLTGHKFYRMVPNKEDIEFPFKFTLHLSQPLVDLKRLLEQLASAFLKEEKERRIKIFEKYASKEKISELLDLMALILKTSDESDLVAQRALLEKEVSLLVENHKDLQVDAFKGITSEIDQFLTGSSEDQISNFVSMTLLEILHTLAQDQIKAELLELATLSKEEEQKRKDVSTKLFFNLKGSIVPIKPTENADNESKDFSLALWKTYAYVVLPTKTGSTLFLEDGNHIVIGGMAHYAIAAGELKLVQNLNGSKTLQMDDSTGAYHHLRYDEQYDQSAKRAILTALEFKSFDHKLEHQSRRELQAEESARAMEPQVDVYLGITSEVNQFLPESSKDQTSEVSDALSKILYEVSEEGFSLVMGKKYKYVVLPTKADPTISLENGNIVISGIAPSAIAGELQVFQNLNGSKTLQWSDSSGVYHHKRLGKNEYDQSAKQAILAGLGFKSLGHQLEQKSEIELQVEAEAKKSAESISSKPAPVVAAEIPGQVPPISGSVTIHGIFGGQEMENNLDEVALNLVPTQPSYT
jgi:hypothetical protein